jgi:hydrogenase maturation protease
MKNVLIAGIGNILLGDDGVGPYIARLLTAHYRFEEGVEVADLGTPALDLIDQICGRDAVILIDSIKLDREPGTVVLYRKSDIVHISPSVRVDPHSPALVETLLSAELFASAPTDLLLIGIVGSSYDPGCRLSERVVVSVPKVVSRICKELKRLDVGYRRRERPASAAIWWTTQPEVLAGRRPG